MSEHFAKLEQRVTWSELNKWLGVTLIEASEDEVKLKLPWRKEFGGAPQMIHGGILAALVDIATFAALMAKNGQTGPTVDLRIDYHRKTFESDLTAIGRVIKSGKTISVIEAEIQDEQENLIATGRCVYMSSRNPIGQISQ